MDCSLPGFPALYHLPEFAQTHGPGEGRAKEPDGGWWGGSSHRSCHPPARGVAGNGGRYFSGTSQHCWLWAGPLCPSLSMALEENKHGSPTGSAGSGRMTTVPLGNCSGCLGPLGWTDLGGRALKEPPSQTGWQESRPLLHSGDLGGHRVLRTETAVTEGFCRALRPGVRGPNVQNPICMIRRKAPSSRNVQASLQKPLGGYTHVPSLPASLRHRLCCPTRPVRSRLLHLSLHLLPSSPISPFCRYDYYFHIKWLC